MTRIKPQRIKEMSEELSGDSQLILRALYELTLEACGGNLDLMHSLPEDELPKIFEEDLHKRYLKLGGKE